ncbi:MAG: isoprenyl transferase [Deltaproteobacteria bacterium]|jgi:undecaprenyl diphosphate synthase|nr:isoprenyl transferase [Deltaproteobacteria bacterium]
MHRLLKEKLPHHLAIIMDGNGRWAEKRSLDRVEGHRQGAESVRTIVRASREIGVPYLTLFAFSSENWNRPRPEVDALMILLKHYLSSELQEMLDRQIRLLAVGELSRLPKEVQTTLSDAMKKTAHGTGMTLTLALSYGGRDDILQAIRRLMSHCQDRSLTPQEITEELFSKFLWTANLPDPDLLIRTSGEMRISNFLLWQLAYAEIFFTPTLWPDFSKEEFIQALLSYQNRERRFGLTSEQIRAEGG